MKKKGKNKKRALPRVKKTKKGKKTIKKFLHSEKGKISKRNAAKFGMGVLAAGLGLSGLMKAGGVDAACWNYPAPTTATTATTATTEGY